MAKRLRKLKKLQGEVPCLYKRETIFAMCLLINALVDAVNYLSDEVEELKKEKASGEQGRGVETK